jgi:hypothetical protein
MLTKLTIFVGVAAILAAIPTTFADQRSFEEISVREAMADQANITGAKCPLSQESVDRIDIALLAICLNHGLAAYEAAQRYPAIAPNVFVVYGQDETFQKILDKYGHEVIPVIAYYVENGSREAQIGQTIREVMHSLGSGDKPKWKLADITPEQVGLVAINRIAARGHEMLAGFEIVDGTAKPKWLTRALLGTKNLLFGGIADIETILVRGERLPTWKEVGWAALDATIVAGAVGAVAKAARIGVRTVGLAEKSTFRVAGEGAIEAITTIGKTSVRIAPVAFLYVAVTRPHLIAAAGGWLAEQMGFSRRAGIFAVYFIGFLALLLLLRPLWQFARLLSMPVRFVLRHG